MKKSKVLADMTANEIEALLFTLQSISKRNITRLTNHSHEMPYSELKELQDRQFKLMARIENTQRVLVLR